MANKKSKENADKQLAKVVDLCYEMLELADCGDMIRADDGCGVVYGALRDAAYKIRKLAENELNSHGNRIKIENLPIEKVQ